MAKRIKASKIQEAIQKAQRVGEVEEKFTLAGCDIVLRSLQPGEIQAVLDEIDDLEDLEYVTGYRFGHLSRSIIEINGESLREAEFIEVEVEEEVSGVKQVKTIALERYKFIAEYILASWSQEAINSAFRKFADVLEKAEQRAVEGVEFRVPDETPEDKFKRLLVEAKELEGQIPFELVGRILSEIGYLSKSSKEELETIDKRLARMASEINSGKTVEGIQEGSEPDATPTTSTAQATPRPARVPLNQRPVSVPVPIPQVVTRAEPTEERQQPLIQLSPEVLRRSREAEALEGGLGETPVSYHEAERFSGVPVPAIQSSTRVAESVPSGSVVAVSPITRVDPNSLGSILDRPPVAGVNPRYRPPPKGG
jgi:hypothetical protein